MAKLEWKVFRESDALDVTEYVREINVSWGRATPISPIAGRTARIVINNGNEQADLFTVNDIFIIREQTSELFAFVGPIITRDYQDTAGTGKGSTCTITLADAFTLAGNQQISVTLTSAKNQLEELALLLTNPNASTSGYWNLFGETDCAFSIGAFTGNLQSQIQQIVLADRGILLNNDGYSNYVAPSEFGTLIVSVASGNFTYGRTATSTQIAYDRIDRSEAASYGMWFNNATITGASTTATKSNGSSAQYGVKSFTSTTTQTEKVNSTAEWYANNFITPTRLNLELSFLDVAQTSGALTRFMNYVVDSGHFGNVTWTVPGGSSETETFFPDRVNLYIEPSSTRVTLGMTNINSYQNFILNDTTFGVLDTSRLSVGVAI
jgi:hypothetical protein